LSTWPTLGAQRPAGYPVRPSPPAPWGRGNFGAGVPSTCEQWDLAGCSGRTEQAVSIC
jgi:hypothetical protein